MSNKSVSEDKRRTVEEAEKIGENKAKILEKTSETGLAKTNAAAFKESLEKENPEPKAGVKKTKKETFTKIGKEGENSYRVSEHELLEIKKKRLADLESEIFTNSKITKQIKFLENKATISIKPVKNNSNLLEAAGSGDIKRIEELLSNGVDVNTKNQFGYTALMHAAYKGELQSVKALVAKQVDINFQQTAGATGNTALMWAVFSGKGDVVNFLLENGAEIDIQDKRFGETALVISTYKYNPEATKYLLEKGADIKIHPNNKLSPLLLAASRGFNKTVKLLLAAGADPNDISNNEPVLLSAISSNDVETVKLLIKAGAEVNYKSTSAGYPLDNAVHFGNFDIVKLLVDNGADVNFSNKYNYTALIAACNEGHYNIAKYLIEKGANVNVSSKNKISPLKEAVEDRQLDLVKILIGRGADVNVVNSNAMTPIFFAVSNNDLEMVKLLVESGADVNAVSKFGSLLSRSLSKSANVEILKLLIKSGADFYKKYQNGKSPVDYQVFASDEQRMFLLDEGLLKIQDCLHKNGERFQLDTTLFISCLESGKSDRFIEIVEFLRDKSQLEPDFTRELKVLAFEHADKKAYEYLSKFDRTKYVLDNLRISRMNLKLLLRHYKESIYPLGSSTKKAIAWSVFIESLSSDLLKNTSIVIKDLDKNRALHEVVRVENLEVLKLLIKEGADINYNASGKQDPIIFRAMNKHYKEILNYILSLNPDYSLGGRNYRNTLQLAAMYQNYDAFKKIRESGQKVLLGFEKDFKSIRDGRPEHFEMYHYFSSLGCKYTNKATMHLAQHLILTKKDNLEELKAFLQSGLSSTVKNYILTDLAPQYFSSAIFDVKKADLIRTFIIPKGYKFPSKVDPLVRCVNNSYAHGINYLYSNNLGNKDEALKVAISKNSKPYLYRMIKERVFLKLNIKNLQSLINYAGSLGDTDLLKYIAEKYPEHIPDLEIVKSIINIKDFDKYLEIKARHPEIFQNNEMSLIFTAIWSNNLEVLKDLLNKENIEKFSIVQDYQKDKDGKYQHVDVLRTPLMMAVDRKKFEVVKLLLEEGADINRVTDIRDTAFTIACDTGSLEMMEYLAIKGANIHIKMKQLDSPLVKAFKGYDGLNKVKLFFKYGLSKEVTDFEGNNPLHMAFNNDKPKIAKYLLDLGISYLVKNDNGILAGALAKGECKSVLKDFKEKWE